MEDIKGWSDNPKKDLTPIESIDLGNEDDCYYYVCPYCGESCYNEDGHITLEEK